MSSHVRFGQKLRRRSERLIYIFVLSKVIFRRLTLFFEMLLAYTEVQVTSMHRLDNKSSAHYGISVDVFVPEYQHNT